MVASSFLSRFTKVIVTNFCQISKPQNYLALNQQYLHFPLQLIVDYYRRSRLPQDYHFDLNSDR